METITVYVGSIVSLSSGITQDTTREVKFVGEKLAEHTDYGRYGRVGITDTRGVTETLYRTEDSRLIVQVKDWSHWGGEPTTFNVVEVVETDLRIGGRFEALGAKAGLGRPLTLNEALSEHTQPA